MLIAPQWYFLWQFEQRGKHLCVSLIISLKGLFPFTKLTTVSILSSEQKANRAARGRARYEMEKKGKVKKGQDVGHSDSNPLNNNPSNLKAESVKKNRGKTNKNGKRI